MKKSLACFVSAIVLAGFVMPAEADTVLKRRRPNFFERLLGVTPADNVGYESPGAFEGPDRGNRVGKRRKPTSDQWWLNGTDESVFYDPAFPSSGRTRNKNPANTQAAFIDPEVAAGIGMGNLTYFPPVVVPVVDAKFSKLSAVGDENNAIRLTLSDRGTEIRAVGEIRKAVIEYYKANGFKPLWTANGTLTTRGTALLGLLSKADEEGLDAQRYLPKPLASFSEAASAIEGDGLAVAQLDVGLTVAALSYAQHLSGGAFEPERLSGYNDLKPQRADATATLNALSWVSFPDVYLAGLAPKHPVYAVLKAELAAIESSNGDQAAFPDGPRVKVGKADSRVPQLRDVMSSLNFITEADAIVEAGKEEVLDKKLSKALKKFQESKAIAQTGQLDGATVKALSGPDRNAMREALISNLERLRWLPKELGTRHVFVNQAAFRVDVVDNGKPVWTSRVIVGKPMTQTAVFSDKMETVVFNPSWGVPQSILLNEYLPKLRKDPGYLDRIGFRVVSKEGKVVSSRAINWYGVGSDSQIGVQQPPGGDNALGELKFLFPNAHSIYMHDTPTRDLFSRSHRAFSHGCVRVQNPREFAQVLLGWDETKVADKLAAGEESGESSSVQLKVAVPVHLTYFTAWPDDTGKVVYYSDFYERDKAMAQARMIVKTGRQTAGNQKLVESDGQSAAQVLQ